MGHSSASVPDCNWLRSDCLTLNRLSMPWRVLTLLCLAVFLSGAQGFRVKRQFSSPSYQPQQWTFDQVSYQQSYGYQQGYQQAYGHDPNYHNYYQRRDISRHQAPTGWNLNTYNYAGYNYPGYGYPYNSYYPQQYSGYPTPPPAQNSGNAYGSPPIIREQQIIYSNTNNMAPSQQQDAYPTPPANWDKNPRNEYVGLNPAAEGTTQISVIYPSSGATSSPPILAKEPKDGSGNPDKHGIELTKEKDLDSEENFLKTAVEEDIDSTINKKLSPGQPSGEEVPGEVSSTTLSAIDEKLKSVTRDMTTSDIVNEIMATTPSDAASSENPLFVDVEESSQSSTSTYPEEFTQDTAAVDNPSPASTSEMSTTAFPDVASTEASETSLDASSPSSRPNYPEEITQDPTVANNQPPADSTVPLDEFIPTEVPAATAPPDPEPETDAEATTAAESSSSANSDEAETLRAPPLPKQVIDKLKELGLNLLKMF
ncbi:hypothetical protein ANCCAN_30573 [Ancylostoma caninum]|uniref:Uncharacterized protein n=1 Tax=Ancylostoma caninum TaxID=29170 RepID=A0A368EY85_ANCCA|nr:hypothetical protein ANCCAN_30573 [Ancylostoma caninum]